MRLDPRKKPKPFRVFFDPVSNATNLNNVEWLSFGTINLTALLELIFVKSLATPDNPCAKRTNTSENIADHNGLRSDSRIKETICRVSPESNIDFIPNRDPNQPPIRFVRTPINS